MATVVGETIRISGHLGGDEDLTIRGRVDGRVELSRTLIVEPSGVVKAEVAVRNAIVSGVVVGPITASDSVELTADARVVGDVTAPRVIIVDGASFKGQVDMGDLEMERPTTPRPTASAQPSAAARPIAKRPSTTAPAPARRETPPARETPSARTTPSRPSKSEEQVVAATPAKASKAKAAKAPSKPPKPPPPSQKKRKVKVKKRR